MTVTLKTVSCGTDLTIVQEGVPDMIPPEMCYLGWQDSLINSPTSSSRKSPIDCARFFQFEHVMRL